MFDKKCLRCKSEKMNIVMDSKYHYVYKCSECNHMSTERIEDCCRRPDKIVTIEHREDNLFRLYHQCLNCGGAYRTKPLSHKKYSSEIRTEFNFQNFENWRLEKQKDSDELWEILNQNNYETSKYAKYIEYLNSIEWKNKRIEVFKRDDNLCQECKDKPAEQVHHKTYENLYNEPLDDLVSVCKECHTEIHRLLDIEEMKKIRQEFEIKKKATANNV